MPTAGEAKIGPTNHYNLRAKPLPRTKSVVGQRRTIPTARGKENVQRLTTTTAGKGPVTRSSSSKIPLPSSSSLAANLRGKMATKNKTARKGVPDFAKLHKQWQNKFEKGKAVNKKTCTQVKEFDLTRPGTQFQGAYFDGDRGEGNIHFEEDEMALQSILNERGVADDTLKVTRNTIATSEMRPRAPTSVRKTLGSIPAPTSMRTTLGSIPVPQSTRPERRQTRGPTAGPKETREDLPVHRRGGRKSMVERQREMGIEFEADAEALESIISNRGVSHARAAAPPASRQTFATSRGMAGQTGGSFYGRQSQKRTSIWYQPEQKSTKEVYEAYLNTVVRRLTVGEGGPATANRTRPSGARPAASTVRNSIYRNYSTASCVKSPFNSQARPVGASAPRATPGRVRAGPEHHLGSSGKPRTPASRVPNPHFQSVLQRQEISSSPLLSETKPCHLSNTAKKKVQWAEQTVAFPSAKDLATSLFPDQADNGAEEQKKQLEKKKEMEELERQLELEIEMLSALNDSVIAPERGTADPEKPEQQVASHQSAPSELPLSPQSYDHGDSTRNDTDAKLPSKIAWHLHPADTTRSACPPAGFVATVEGPQSGMGYRGTQSYMSGNMPRDQNLTQPLGANLLNAESLRAQELAMNARPISHTRGGMTSLQYSTISQPNFNGGPRQAAHVVAGGGYTSLEGYRPSVQGSLHANTVGVWHSQSGFHGNLVGTGTSQAGCYGDIQCTDPPPTVSTATMPYSSTGVWDNGTNYVPPQSGNYGNGMSSLPSSQQGYGKGPSMTSIPYKSAAGNLVPPATITVVPGLQLSHQLAGIANSSFAPVSYLQSDNLQQWALSGNIVSKSEGHFSNRSNDSRVSASERANPLPSSVPIHHDAHVPTHTSSGLACDPRSADPTSIYPSSEFSGYRSTATMERHIPPQQGGVYHQSYTQGKGPLLSSAVREPIEGGQNVSFAPISRVTRDITVAHQQQVMRPQATNVNKTQMPHADSLKAKGDPEPGTLQEVDVCRELSSEKDGVEPDQSHVGVLTSESSASEGPTFEQVTKKVLTEASRESTREGEIAIPQSEIDNFLATIRGEGVPGVGAGGKAGSLSLRSEMPPSLLYASISPLGKVSSPQLEDTSLDQECTLFACSLRESPSRGRAHMNPIAKIFAGDSDMYFCPIMEDE